MRSLLINLIVKITGKPRYIPVIQWSNTSWTYNMFRVWEMCFGKKLSVQPSATTSWYHDENGHRIVTHYFHSLEPLVMHLEDAIRGLFKFAPIRVYVQSYAPAGMPGIAMSPSPFLLAIAFDDASQGTYGASPDTFNHTTAGSDRIMMGVGNTDNNTITAFTYNTVAFTHIVDGPVNSAIRKAVELYYLLAPATGTNQVSVSASESVAGAVSTFTGVKQSAQPDSFNTGVDGGSGEATATVTTTVVAADCFLIGALCDNQGSGGSGGTNTTVDETNAQGMGFFHSTAAVAAGSRSLIYTFGGSPARWGGVIASIAPQVAAGPNNMKSYNGNVKANIKSMFGNLLANVKSFDGNS